MKKKTQLNEVRQLQKVAGILKESNIPDEVPNTVEACVDYFYEEATPKEKRKLVNIYRHEMENLGATDPRDFFDDLVDADDFVSLEDLGDFSGYDE